MKMKMRNEKEYRSGTQKKEFNSLGREGLPVLPSAVLFNALFRSSVKGPSLDFPRPFIPCMYTSISIAMRMRAFHSSRSDSGLFCSPCSAVSSFSPATTLFSCFSPCPALCAAWCSVRFSPVSCTIL